ncbi:MAG: ABC-ATPase domain-containing protein [Pseudomonadales bacterium]|nr:ABC-ATPase domain-containing protein [Pseudomonadales bacterium]
MQTLRNRLCEIDQKSYKNYKKLQGCYQFKKFQLHIDHVQGDPFAEPSRCRVFIKADTTQIPQALYAKHCRKIALEDYLGRCFSKAIATEVKTDRGSGKSGIISIADYGQQVLARNTVLVDEGDIELRLQIALPADKRCINAQQASIMLFEELPALLDKALDILTTHPENVWKHVWSVENQQALRRQLADKKLVAFIADGARLPRLSGVDDGVLPRAAACIAPASLAVWLDQIDAPPLRGLGIPAGVTLIVGGGFHGKSTLLYALERGVYDHIPGDGREAVVTLNSAVKVRAEDRRAITGVDISPFINNLPQEKDTRFFSTQDASGSTSQAANIIEAISTGAKVLLIDEDTSASNFMIRDARMQALIAKDKEPITPLVQRIQDLRQQLDISVTVVMGGSGDFFDVADTVIMMDNYLPIDVSQQAKDLALEKPNSERAFPALFMLSPRVLKPHCLNPANHLNKDKIQALDKRILRYGNADIDLSRVEQLVDNAQLTAIGYLMFFYYQQLKRGDFTGEDLVQDLAKILQDIEQQGLDKITPYIMGTLALPRLYELVATINRMRNLEIHS